MSKRLYRVSEFLSAFGIGRTKFYSEVAAGRLNIVRLGNRATRVLADDAEEWLRKLTPVLTHDQTPDCQKPKPNNGEQQKRPQERKGN